MTEPEPMVASIKWDKKSKKVGKLLEQLADAVEAQAHRRSEELLDEAFNDGYDLALSEVQRFGLPYLLTNRARSERAADSE